MLHPFAQNRISLANLDACFKKEAEKVTKSSKESSFCKPFVEDETVIGGPSFAIDEAERIINNPVNITLQDSMNHLTAETPILVRKMHQKICTQFFQNRRPTPLPKEGVPRPLLQPTPSPCDDDRTFCMAQLFSRHLAGEQKKVSPQLPGLKEENDKSITKEQDLLLEKSICNSGKPKAFSFRCLTPAIQGRSPVNCSPVLGFTFDSPLSPLPVRVERRSNDSDPTPPTAKRRLKKKFSSLSKRRGPGFPMNYDEEQRRSLKKRKLSPIVQIMRRKSPVNSPACSGLYSKSSLLSSGKKLFLHTPRKFSFSPENMMNSPLELTRC